MCSYHILSILLLVSLKHAVLHLVVFLHIFLTTCLGGAFLEKVACFNVCQVLCYVKNAQ